MKKCQTIQTYFKEIKIYNFVNYLFLKNYLRTYILDFACKNILHIYNIKRCRLTSYNRIEKVTNLLLVIDLHSESLVRLGGI